MWQTIKARMDFTERLCGSVPQSKEIVNVWLDSRKPKVKSPDGKSLKEIEEEVLATIEQDEERTTLGFQSDDQGFFVRGGTVKAHLKDCANQIKDIMRIKAFRAKIANKLYLREYRVYLLKDGQPVKESDGSFVQTVHVMTPQGPRTGLKTIHYVERPSLQFVLQLLEDSEVKPETITRIFEYGSVHGYGGERGMGEGRYSYQLEK